MMKTEETPSLLVCPACHGVLHINDTLRCTACGKTYERAEGGFLDMRVDSRRYEDWLSGGDEALAQWRAHSAPIEEEGARHMIGAYLIPLLQRLGLGPGSTLLSVGCGGGWDVEALQEAGYRAWGSDNGGRIAAWAARREPETLCLSDALKLPFQNDAFDMVFCEGVIEHIGYPGDTLDPAPDRAEQRQRFADSLLRVTAPGGYIFVACPNRLFPIDFFHGSHALHGLAFRPHSPFERFLLSFGDIEALFGAQASGVRPLSLDRFFNLEKAAERHTTLAPLFRAADTVAGWLPPAFWRTPLSPYLVVLVKKRGEE